MEELLQLARVPRAGLIPDRIASYASATPSQLAVVDAARRMTYRELEVESNQIAARLQAAGAGPERCVGLLLERSTGFVAAALGVLKTGAAYVPLDRSTPPDRASSILADAGVVALVTDSSGEGSPKVACPVITIEDLGADQARSLVRPEIDPDTLAYIVYTSGSTGQPKGVEVTHANLGNLIEWHERTFAVSAADRASQVASLAFDAAGWEIWPYLAAGASVHIADESTRRLPEMLRDWLVAQRITIGFVPTALAEQLFRADWPAETALRFLLTGGDTLARRPPSGLPFTVINNYGPTECTVVATSGMVADEESRSDRPSIGHPIAGATALVLDDALKPVAPGESGELCIGGPLVARSYHNMPELTARQFVSYETSPGVSLRLYRTGDRARLLEGGEIEFLGRFDDQVKIRGHRIEPGEIAMWLSRYPGVAGSTVCVTDGAAEPALVAYVVPSGDAQLTEPKLREYLAAKLPDYMVPSLFVSIEALPTTTSGKVDKTALPAPRPENRLKAPRDGNSAGLEKQITELVASLMSRSSIEPDENFFMVGGHSMFGVQLVARIREAFGVKLPLRQAFTAPTVRELSAEVARLIAAG